MAHTLLLVKIKNIFAECMRHDRIDLRIDPELPAPPSSLRELLQNLLDHSGMKEYFNVPHIANFEMTLSEYMAMPVTARNQPGSTTISSFIQSWCLAISPSLISEASLHSPHNKTHIEEQQAFLEESGFSSDSELWRSVHANKQFIRDIQVMIFKDICSTLGSRTLKSFFLDTPSSNGYFGWHPGVKTQCGRRLPDHKMYTIHGEVIVTVQEYEENEGPVHAYEWSAELRKNQQDGLPDAVACGMLYKFETEFGLATGDRSDLLWAADSVADTDVLQVRSFLDQHLDADELMDESDLCFVWLWERRQGASKGAGRSCIEAALKDLKKRFRRTKTVIFELTPGQFKTLKPELDPPTIQTERQEAVENIHEYICTIAPEKIVNGECRFITNREGDDPEAALLALGRDMIGL